MLVYIYIYIYIHTQRVPKNVYTFYIDNVSENYIFLAPSDVYTFLAPSIHTLTHTHTHTHIYIYIYIHTYTEGAKKCIHILHR